MERQQNTFNPELFKQADKKIFEVAEKIRGKGTGENYSDIGIRNPVKYDTAPLLTSTARLLKPQRIVELGTSYGFSGLHLKAGSPEARLDTVEFDARVAQEARDNFAEAGVVEVFVHNGSSSEFCSKRTEPIDLLFIDHNKSDYYVDFLTLEPFMAPGGVIMADNVNDRRKECGDLVDYVLDNYEDSIVINTEAGLLFARKGK